MSVKTSANRFPIDALSIFRAAGLATVAVSTGSTNAMTLDQLSSYWSAGENASLLQFAIECQVESIGQASGGPATATFSVQIDTDSAFTSPVAITVETSKVMSAAGFTTLLVDREKINEALTALSVTTGVPVYLQVYITIGGGATTPAVPWNAYASPLLGL